MKRVVGLAVVLILLTPGLIWAEMLSVKNKRVNFREGPSTSKKIVYSAERYYPVKVLARKGGWAKTKDFEGDVAWVLERLMGKTKCVVVKVQKANLRSHARKKGSKIIFTAARGAAFKLLKRQGKWLLVQHADGDKGWIHKNLVWGL